MKKVLIISYYFPPANFVASERIKSFAKHLKEFDLFPIVITRRWNENQTNTYEKIDNNSFEHEVNNAFEVYHMPYNRTMRDKLFDKKNTKFIRLFRKALTLLELVLSRYFIKSIPSKNLYSQARELLKSDSDISALIISGSPFETFHFGYKLKKEFPQIGWYPDYRDEWTSHQKSLYSSKLEKLINKTYRSAEKKWTSNCTSFITVSDVLKKNLSAYISKPGFVVMNGFEEDEINLTETNNDKNSFVLSYSGSIYPYQDFSVIANAMSEIILKFADKIKIEIQFFGLTQDKSSSAKIEHLFAKSKDHLKILDRLPKADLIQKLVDSDVLLLTSYGEVDGCYPVKMFDYYQVAKPIVLCPTDESDIEAFVKETASGFWAKDEKRCVEIIEDLIEQKIKGTPFKLQQNKEIGKFYTRNHQAKILAENILAQKIQVK